MARQLMTVQLDLFSNPSASGIAQAPRWQSLPPSTRQALTSLIVLLLLEHIDGAPTAGTKEAHDDL
ncbi:MAG: hypothetical protein KGJ57_21225 [Sphingomonadales bacterium]|nr:hypothetical protein [Sphingomonadales bacterium]MDE2171919.1 hypothetical protein [Sphingomonadales bacterium]